MPEPAFDVFLSHSSMDKDIVRPIAERLRADGLRVWFDEWAILAGDSIPSKVNEGLEQSRILVLCMSANAFGSDWSLLESYTNRFRDPLNRARRFIPLRLDEAPIKRSLEQFLYINWADADRERAYAQLLAACRPPADPSATDVPVDPKPAPPDPPPTRAQSEFLAQILRDMRSKPGVNAAYTMLDDYRKRRIDFGPVGIDGGDNRPEVSTQDLVVALAETDPDDDPREAVFNAIRDSFDAFFDGLEFLEVNLRAGAIHRKDVESLVAYWIQQFADAQKSKKGPDFVAAARSYVVKYYPGEVQALAGRFGWGF